MFSNQLCKDYLASWNFSGLGRLCRQRSQLAKPSTRRLFLITRLRRACNCPAKDPKPTNPKPASPSLESKNKQLRSPAKNRAIYKRNSLKETTEHSSPSSTCANSRNCDHLGSQIKKTNLLGDVCRATKFFRVSLCSGDTSDRNKSFSNAH